jgi:hypothetical protein
MPLAPAPSLLLLAQLPTTAVAPMPGIQAAGPSRLAAVLSQRHVLSRASVRTEPLWPMPPAPAPSLLLLARPPTTRAAPTTTAMVRTVPARPPVVRVRRLVLQRACARTVLRWLTAIAVRPLHHNPARPTPAAHTATATVLGVLARRPVAQVRRPVLQHACARTALRWPTATAAQPPRHSRARTLQLARTPLTWVAGALVLPPVAAVHKPVPFRALGRTVPRWPTATVAAPQLRSLAIRKHVPRIRGAALTKRDATMPRWVADSCLVPAVPVGRIIFTPPRTEDVVA